VDFCQEDGVSCIAVGDVRDIQTGASLGHVTNQKISQWPYGQFARYLTEKAARLGDYRRVDRRGVFDKNLSSQ
jgi:transposase